MPTRQERSPRGGGGRRDGRWAVGEQVWKWWSKRRCGIVSSLLDGWRRDWANALGMQGMRETASY